MTRTAPRFRPDPGVFCTHRSATVEKVMYSSRLFLVFLSFLPALSRAAEGPVVFRGAVLHTAAGASIEKGVLVVDRGKLVAVGSEGKVDVPKGARTVDLSGRVVIPGMVDTHSHVGIWPRPHVPAHNDGNEGSGPVQAGLRAVDALFPDDPGVRMALAGGITTA